MANNKDELMEQVSRMIIECRSQDVQIDEWGERELRDDIMELITKQTQEAYNKGYIDGGIEQMTKPIKDNKDYSPE